MGRPKTKIDKQTVKNAKKALKEIRDHKLCTKLNAIIAAEKHPITTIAEIYGVHRTTLHRWIDRFQDGGTDELRDKPKGHRKPKLKKRHKRVIEDWLSNRKDSEGNRIHWTLRKLKKEIYKVFGIEITLMPLWRHLKKMGFSLRKPRPKHYKADEDEQEEYKKK